MPLTPNSMQGANGRPLNRDSLLAVCATMKPGPGSSGQSATRSLVEETLINQIGAVYCNVHVLDLRETPVPFFQGLLPEKIDDPHFQRAYQELDSCGAVLFAIPAYWAGVSGVFKNFIDVVCGPVYDFVEGRKTVFQGKPAGILVVAADEASAEPAAVQASTTLRMAGALLIGNPVTVVNPRNHPEKLAAANIQLLELHIALIESLLARDI